jgi:hypothetical protein
VKSAGVLDFFNLGTVQYGRYGAGGAVPRSRFWRPNGVTQGSRAGEGRGSTAGPRGSAVWCVPAALRGGRPVCGGRTARDSGGSVASHRRARETQSQGFRTGRDKLALSATNRWRSAEITGKILAITYAGTPPSCRGCDEAGDAIG